MNGIGGIGGWELLLVAVIAMLVLGPEHMVKHAYRFGRWARKFSGYWQEAVGAFREQLKDIEKEAVDGAHQGCHEPPRHRRHRRHQSMCHLRQQ